MPTNVYFDTGTTSEQRLYEDLIIEQLKIYGQDVYYLPRKLANKDTIFGEDPTSSFDDSYIIEMYVDNSDGYMGEQEIIKKFGLELRDDIRFTLSKSRWETLIKNNSDLVVERPQEGDLVYSLQQKHFLRYSLLNMSNRSINKVICLFTNYLVLDLSTVQKELILVLQR